MSDAWAAVGALGVLIVPLALAWWLLGRGERAQRRRRALREKMKR